MNSKNSILEGLLERAGVINHIIILIWLIFEGISHSEEIFDKICRYSTNPLWNFLQFFSFAILTIALFLIILIGIITLYKKISKKPIHNLIIKSEEFILSKKFRFFAIPTISFAIITAFTFARLNNRIDSQPWILKTSWPNAQDENSYLSTMREDLAEFAEEVYQATNKKIKIDYDDAFREKPEELFEMLRKGEIHILSSVQYYWPSDSIDSSRVGDFFAAVPFGKEYEEFTDWIENGGGQSLWDSICLKYNVKPFAFGHTGNQPSGWFKEPFSMKTIRNLRIRLMPLQGEVIRKLKGESIMVPPNKIGIRFQDSIINAAEWIGPYEDIVLRLNKIPEIKYYYIEGWHEEDDMLGLFVNNVRYKRLDSETREILTQIIAKYNLKLTAKFALRNAWALEYLKKSNHQFNIETNIDPALKDSLYKAWIEVLKEHCKNDSLFKKVFINYAKHHLKWIVKKDKIQKENLKYNYADPKILEEINAINN